MARNTKKKPELKNFTVTVTTTGKAHVSVMAVDAEDAKRKMMDGEGDDGLHEWEYDEILGVTEDA